MKIKRRRSSDNVYPKVKRMVLTALFMGTAAYIGEHYVKDPTTNFMQSESGSYPSSYSGLYVNADVLGVEGER